MAIFKMLHGDESNISLEITPFHEGWVYITSSGYYYVDLNIGTTESPNNQRIKLNAANAETLCGITLEEIQKSINYDDLANKPTLGTLASKSEVSKTELTSALKEEIEGKANVVDIPTVPTNVSAFTNDAGYLTEHQSLAGLATEDYVKGQIEAIPTPDVSGQINTHNTSSAAHNDIRTAIEELGNAVDNITVPTTLSDLTDDATHRLVTDTEKTAWNAKADTSDIPTKVSELTNDSGFITSDEEQTLKDELNDYIDNELQAAKDNGEFKGEKGVSIINIRIEEVSL